MSNGKDEKTVICTKCRKEFTIPFGEQPYKMCRECREYNRKARERSLKGLTGKPKPKRNLDTLSRVMIEVDEYNEKYHTKYSYGQYMAAKENGWLQRDWSEWEEHNK